MGPIGLPELIVILVVALLVLGPKKLPEVARNLGKGLAEFRRAAKDVETQVKSAIAEADREAEKTGPAASAPARAEASKPAAEKSSETGQAAVKDEPGPTRAGGGGGTSSI